MSTQPTSGPWIIATSNSWRRIVSERDSTPVCEPIKQPDGHPDLHFPNGGADGPDAHVLEAAWDMYEALRIIDARLRECMAIGLGLTAADAYDSFYQEIVRAALAKAEGKS